MNQLENFTFGDSFNESKPVIKSYFSGKPYISNTKIAGFYRITYENTPFSSYGASKYIFQYVKEKLVGVRVELEFLLTDFNKFKLIFKELSSDLNDKSKKKLPEYGKFEPITILDYIETEFRKQEIKEVIPGTDLHNKLPELKYWNSYWAIYNSEEYTGNILSLEVLIGGTSRPIEPIQGLGSTYNGGLITLSIEVIPESLQELVNMERQMRDGNPYIGHIDKEDEIQLKIKNGTYVLPVKINNVLNIDFVFDPGASDVSISPDIFLVLYKAGTISESDFIGEQTYKFADGSTARSSVFNLSSIQIGHREIKNVRASISNNINSPLLLGQSALKKLVSYRINNENQLLIIE